MKKRIIAWFIMGFIFGFIISAVSDAWSMARAEKAASMSVNPAIADSALELDVVKSAWPGEVVTVRAWPGVVDDAQIYEIKENRERAGVEIKSASITLDGVHAGELYLAWDRIGWKGEMEIPATINAGCHTLELAAVDAEGRPHVTRTKIIIQSGSNLHQD